MGEKKIEFNAVLNKNTEKMLKLALIFFGGYFIGTKVGFGKGYGKGLKDAFTQKGTGFIHGK